MPLIDSDSFPLHKEVRSLNEASTKLECLPWQRVATALTDTLFLRRDGLGGPD